MLRDLEELLHSAIDDGSRDFMGEAVRCYYAGLHRAAVVMAMAASMDDLRRKLGELVATGISGIDVTVKDAHARIETKFKDQDAFENDLIETTTKLGMFSPSESAKLKMLLKVRHLCAHPSGHQSSAEEARDCVASLIDLILARPPLMGVTAVNSLIERLKQPHFFPMLSDDARTATAVQTELSPLVVQSHPALASRLVDAIISEVAQPTQPPSTLHSHFPTLQWTSPARQNLRAFARFMTSASDSARRAVWSRVGRLVEKPETCVDALSVLAADPSGLKLLEDSPLSRERAVALVRRNIGMSDARKVLRGWRGANVLKFEEVSELLRVCEAELVTGMQHSARAELAWPELDALFFAKAVDESGSSTWDRANPAIDAIQGLTASEAAMVPPELRAKYVFNVARHATGVYPNRSAVPLTTRGLGPRMDFLPDVEALLSRPSEARATPTDWPALALILSASGRLDLLHKMLDLFVGASTASDWSIGFPLGRALENHGDPSIAAKASLIVGVPPPV